MKLWPGRRVRYVLLAVAAIGAYLGQRRRSGSRPLPLPFRSVPTPDWPRSVPREEPDTPPMGMPAQPPAPPPAAAKPSPVPAAAKPTPAPAAAKPSPSPVARSKPKAASGAVATSGARTDATAGLPASEPYGVGSALPLADGSPPSPEYTIKGNASSKLFHTPSSPYYGRTIAEVWFRTEDDAKRAGFTGWVRKSSSKQ